MEYINSRANFSVYKWLISPIIIYLLGGALQYFGLLSPTQCNIVVILFFIPVFLSKEILTHIAFELVLLFFIIYTLFLHFLNNYNISNTLTYIYYIAVTIVAAISGRFYANYLINYKKLQKIVAVCIIFLLLELLVCALQVCFTQSFVTFSRIPIGFEDAIFGTFYVQSDAPLAAVCELMIIIAFAAPIKRTSRFLVSALAVAVIFIGHSNTARFAVILVMTVMLLNNKIKMKGRLRDVFGIISFYIAIIAIVLSCFIFKKEINEFIIYVEREYYMRGDWQTAARFAPLGQIFSAGVNWIGEGPLTYYNPITKQWLYNSGFSTLYELYIDYGIIGLCIYVFYQFQLIFKLSTSFLQRTAFIIVFMSYAILNFALTDMSFIFFFNLSLVVISKFKLPHNVNRSRIYSSVAESEI